MVEITQEQMDNLIDLQEIETEAGRINKIISTVDSKIEGLESQLKAYRDAVNEKEQKLNEIKQKYKLFETEFREKEERIEKSKETLKIVQTNKEYQVLLREIDENIKNNSQIEELLIQDLEVIEKEEKELLEKKAELVQLESQVKDQTREIQTECSEEREVLGEIAKKRELISKQIAPKLLNLFNRTLKVSGGLAVVPVNNETCEGCYINIPPQKYIEIQRGGELNYCQRCHRILYYKEVEEEKES